MDSSTTKSKLATTAAISLKPSKTRRGYGRKKAKFNVKSQTLTVVGTNAGGLNLKRESLFSLINQLRPSIITIQETKFMFYGSLKIPGYEIFENLRKDNMGGGLLTAALVDLNPVVITDNEGIDNLVIQVDRNLQSQDY